MESQQTRLLNFVQGPSAGLVTVLATSTTAATQDLRLLDNQTYNSNSATQLATGAQGAYLSIQATGADCYVLVGTTSAAVGSLSPTATGVNAANACVAVPQGTTLRVLLRPNVDLFLGYVTATGTGNLRLWKSSPYDA
jgi:hypothetical protein